MMTASKHAFLNHLNGIIACIIVALAASFLSSSYGAPVMLFALILGMGANFLYTTEGCTQGIDFCATQLLRFGVALLGAGIYLEDLQLLGWDVLLLIIGALVATIVFSTLVCRILGLDRRLGLMSGGAVAICGISAALTLSSVMPKDKDTEKFTTLTVVLIATFGAMAMVAYPVLVAWLDLNATQAGIFLGGSIHDVSHVVGAGFALSEEVGYAAMTVKMVRVAMLIPVAWVFLWLFRREQKVSGQPQQRFPIPAFLMAFVGMMLLTNFGLIPTELGDMFKLISQGCFVLAIVALGIKTSFKSLIDIGFKPIILVLTESLFIGALVLAWILL